MKSLRFYLNLLFSWNIFYSYLKSRKTTKHAENVPTPMMICGLVRRFKNKWIYVESACIGCMCVPMRFWKSCWHNINWISMKSNLVFENNQFEFNFSVIVVTRHKEKCQYKYNYLSRFISSNVAFFGNPSFSLNIRVTVESLI